MEVWRDDQVELSWRVLGTLRELADFIVIGGWGVYFWARKLKSRDIDIYIDQDNFYGLQRELLGRGHVVKRNPRLRKLEALIEGVEVDIYTPFLCNLVVPCKDVLEGGWSSDIEGFRVAAPEILLLLKAQAARERWHAEKGMKDRADLISLVAFADLKFDLLRELLGKYDADRSLVEVVERALRESRVEYGFLDLTYERDGARLRKLVARELE
jgi:hypothetical protein